MDSRIAPQLFRRAQSLNGERSGGNPICPNPFGIQLRVLLAFPGKVGLRFSIIDHLHGNEIKQDNTLQWPAVSDPRINHLSS
jgi:hypothetical protein